MGGLGSGDPEVDVAAPAGPHDVEGAAEGVGRRGQAGGLAGGGVVVHELELPAAITAHHLAVGERPGAVRRPGHQAGDVLAAAEGGVVEAVVRHELLPDLGLGGLDQLLDGVGVAGHERAGRAGGGHSPGG